MPHRIEVDVIQMRRKIAVIPDEVFPVPALPDRALATQLAAGIPIHLTKLLNILPRESFLDQTPTRRVAVIAIRKRPQSVHVVGQHHLRLDDEVMPFPHMIDCITEHRDSARVAE
jgi:hypothetical protein